MDSNEYIPAHSQEWYDAERKRLESLAAKDAMEEEEAWNNRPGKSFYTFLGLLMCLNDEFGLRIMKNCLMVGVLALLIFLFPAYYLTENYNILRALAILAIPTLCLMALYAPWYTVLTLLPFMCIAGWALEPNGTYMQTLGYCWLWSLYALGRGIRHELHWMQEGIKGVRRHKVTNHPWLLTGTSLAVGVGSHYLFQGEKHS